MKELWLRLIYVIISMLLSFLIYTNYFSTIFYMWLSQTGVPYIIITNPMEGVSSFLYLGIFWIIITNGLPFCIIQIYLYIRPGMITSLSPLDLVYMGIIASIIPIIIIKLSTVILLPKTIKFLLSPYFAFEHSNFAYLAPSISSILNIYFFLVLFTIIGILIPLIAILIQIKKGNAEKRVLLGRIAEKYRPISILVISTTISIVTPPDLITLLVLTVPLIIYLELTYLITIIIYNYAVKSSCS